MLVNLDNNSIGIMVEFICEHKIDFVLVVHWDRFSRNTLGSLLTEDTLTKLNIELNCINHWIDHSDPNQRFMLLVNFGIAEVDNKIRSQKVKMGMRQGRKEGRWNVSQPFGYIPGRDGLGKTLMKVDPEKGKLLKNLFEIYFSIETKSSNGSDNITDRDPAIPKIINILKR